MIETKSNNQGPLSLPPATRHPQPSSGVGGVPAQTPSSPHTSLVVASSPSSQVSPGVTVLAQPVAGSQVSAVHGFESSQTSSEPEQVPDSQASSIVQASPSSQVEVGNEHSVELVPSQVATHSPTPAQGVLPPCGGPSVTVVHVPSSPPTSHASHCPSHDPSQQTPSTQKPLVHWFSPAQGTPLSRVAVQIPAAQKNPDTQSVSSEQSPAHDSSTQRYGAHSCVCSSGQEPSPWQAASSTATPSVQEGARHCVSSSGYSHCSASTPSQAPPQTEPSDAHTDRVP
jgi:hypothetical protein